MNKDQAKVCRTQGGGAGVVLVSLTLKVKVSLKAGFSVFRCTLVSYFFFLSGRRKTLT